MTKRRKSNAREQQDSLTESVPPKAPAQSEQAEEELEQRMRSALADVYEALLDASSERDEVEWSGLELVNDLIH